MVIIEELLYMLAVVSISLFHFRYLRKGYLVKTNAFYSVISLLKVPKIAFSPLVDWLRNDGYESI